MGLCNLYRWISALNAKEETAGQPWQLCGCRLCPCAARSVPCRAVQPHGIAGIAAGPSEQELQHQLVAKVCCHMQRRDANVAAECHFLVVKLARPSVEVPLTD